jgi:hypothetical protein
MMATLIGNPKVLDSYTTSMCLDSWGRSNYAQALVEISADQPFKDVITVAIPGDDGVSFSKEKVFIEYEWRPPRCSHCCVFGHVIEACPKQVKQAAKVGNPTVDAEGFVEVKRKNSAKRQGVLVGRQKSKFEYKLVNKAKPGPASRGELPK